MRKQRAGFFGCGLRVTWPFKLLADNPENKWPDYNRILILPGIYDGPDLHLHEASYWLSTLPTRLGGLVSAEMCSRMRIEILRKSHVRGSR